MTETMTETVTDTAADAATDAAADIKAPAQDRGAPGRNGGLPANLPADLPADLPDGLPDKFRDTETGALNIEALVKSYRELESRLGGADSAVPRSPDDYRVAIDHPAMEIDHEVNAALHAAGFTQRQAQLVYDLARDKLLPFMEQLSSAAAGTDEAVRLRDHFGGEDRWQEMSRQLANWGQSHLAPDVYAALASSYDGVVALHKMMMSREPAMVSRDGQSAQAISEAGLKQLMRDPKYWRDQDPALVMQVQRGFEALYPD